METDLRPRKQRPLLLLDIDGVVVLLGTDYDEPVFDTEVAGFPVTIAVAARERLSRLAKVFRIVWASAWQREGAEELGPLVGLPGDLAFLRFDRDLDHDGSNHKLPVIKRFVRNRPAAWLDDELGEDVMAWADERPAPTLLVRPDPRVGLGDAHVDRLVAFATSLDSVRDR